MHQPTPDNSHIQLKCQLCERSVAALTVHHLIPKSQAQNSKQIPTVSICAACHRQLHPLFSNKQLARELYSLEELKKEPTMRRFLRWIRKQDPNKRIKVRR